MMPRSQPVVIQHLLSDNHPLEVRFHEDGLDVLVHGHLAVSFIADAQEVRMVRPSFDPDGDPELLSAFGGITT